MPVLTLVGCLMGCAASQDGAIVYSNPHANTRSPNLALGPSGEHAWLGPQIGGRSDWPVVRTGYRLDDVTYYSSTIYNDESYYNRHGGMHHGSTSVRSGVWLRR